MKVIVLCGGSGTRLWPISRSLYPKQFVKIFNEQSLFQKTILRNTSLAQEFLIVVNQDQYFIALEQITELNINQKCVFILEPVGRNTAPAIALASFHANPDDILLVTPSDHMINHEKNYQKSSSIALQLASENKLVTFGITPTYPETGYGYIQSEKNNHAGPFSKVQSFKEKPDLKTAKYFINEGHYFWNSGMFCFKASTYLEELNNHHPSIYNQSLHAYNNAIRENSFIRIQPENMNKIESESIDYAVMEKSQNVYVVPSDLNWSDLGSFESLSPFLPQDENSNTLDSHVTHLGSKNTMVLKNSQRSISTIDTQDIIIADTEDALVVINKGSGQKVKDLVTQFKKSHPEMTQVHKQAFRPWGSYTVLKDEKNYKVKSISVKPGRKLSLQYHHQRAEHWVVVKGKALVTLGEKEFVLEKNQSVFIPQEERHRLANQENEDLIIIETQIGDYLGEDDIVRIQDDFNRK